MTDYILRITLPADRPEIREAVEGLLFLTETLGTQVDDSQEPPAITAWFLTDRDRAAASEQLARVEGIAIEAFENERVDWLDFYQQSLVAMEIGSKWIVAPDASLIGDSARTPIVIPQERAFGTGGHESTALALEMLEEILAGGERCVDVGTGSGILAIAMAMLGARRAVAFDLDLDSLGVIERNLRRNGISRSAVPHYIGTLDALREEPYDIVVMNILPEVIVTLLPAVERYLAPDARVMVGGILREKRDEFLATAGERGLRLSREKTSGDWWCGVLTR
jgi:ribosomal protein L11 methyltransferase